MEENIRKIGSKAGNVVEVDFVGDVWRGFIRIKVEVHITQPLCPGVFLLHDNLNDLWIILKSEKLVEVCNKCGLIGHAERHCDGNMPCLQNPLGHLFKAFGPWLRANNDESLLEVYVVPHSLNSN